MIRVYAKYDESKVFNDIEEKVDNKIEFIKAFRNIKAENSIPKEAKVLINTDDEIIIKMLKLQDVMVNEELSVNSYKVKSKDIEAIIYYEKVISEEEIRLIEKQIIDLQNSIERRKNLLANENYVNKAPAQLVENERNTLLKEEKELEIIISRKKEINV